MPVVGDDRRGGFILTIRCRVKSARPAAASADGSRNQIRTDASIPPKNEFNARYGRVRSVK